MIKRMIFVLSVIFVMVQAPYEEVVHSTSFYEYDTAGNPTLLTVRMEQTVTPIVC